MELRFIGATRTVTGSKHLITTDKGTRILLDCGLYQGPNEEKNEHLGFDPMQVDHCILSHAHIDHSGALPILAKENFPGRIHCTEPTLDLCEILLKDSAHIQEEDAKEAQRDHKKGKDSEGRGNPLYNAGDASEALELFRTHPYNEWFELEKGIRVEFTFIGHILGSGAVNIEIDEPDGTRRVCYTGDIGRPEQKIIKRPEPFPQAEVIITESTYGDRLHDKMEDAKEVLLRTTQHTCVENEGKLIIPAFSVGRTQEIVYALDQLEEEGKLPSIDCFVDSPMSTNATDIIRNHPGCYNDDFREYVEKNKDPFGFDRLKYVRNVQDSIALNHRKKPCIIISASGMMEGGRILHHLKHHIGDDRNTLLIPGYCEPSTIGGRIRAGEDIIYLFGKPYKVRAFVKTMDSMSAHGDRDEMIDYLSCQDPSQVDHLFLVHGEYETQKNYKSTLKEHGFRNINIPEEGSKFQV